MLEHIKGLLGKEIIAFCGNLKYRGLLEKVFDSGFPLIGNVAVTNQVTAETLEFDKCLLNLKEVSGIVSDDVMGRDSSTEGG